MLTRTGIKWTINSLYSSYLLTRLQPGLCWSPWLWGWLGTAGIWSSADPFFHLSLFWPVKAIPWLKGWVFYKSHDQWIEPNVPIFIMGRVSLRYLLVSRAGVCLAPCREASGAMHPCSGLDLEVHLQRMRGCSTCCAIFGVLPKAGEPSGEMCLFSPSM